MFASYLRVTPGDTWFEAAKHVLAVNIVQGDALTMTTSYKKPLTFPEWAYLTKGKFQRRDFSYSNLTQRSATEGTLFDAFEEHEIFTPVTTYVPMSAEEIAA